MYSRYGQWTATQYLALAPEKKATTTLKRYEPTEFEKELIKVMGEYNEESEVESDKEDEDKVLFIYNIYYLYRMKTNQTRLCLGR